MKKDKTNLKILFMGTSHFADVILNALVYDGYKIVAVFTQPGKKQGRDQEIVKSAVAATAEKYSIPCHEPVDLDDATLKEVKDLNPDIIIVAAYGKILPKSIITLPHYGCLNIHGSHLPKFRGPSPVQNAILQGERETGTTIMLMDEGIDTGDILSQQRILIDPNELYPQLLDRVAQTSSSLLLETLPLWIERKIEPVHQDNTQATLCQLIERQDGNIIWNEPAVNIYNKYRAFQPWPGVYTFWKRNEQKLRIKINKMGMIPKSPMVKKQAGEVFEIGDKIGIFTGVGVITLEEIQVEGKRNLPIKEFINGYPDFLGAVMQ